MTSTLYKKLTGQLRSADEAERQNQEAMAEEMIDAADDDFSSGTH
jgi:hypothetical protein